MRQEDKEVDGFELEREEERKRDSRITEDDEEELHVLDGKPEHAQEHTGTVSAAMHKILEREHIVLNDLDVSQRELRALEALKTAVDGRDQTIHGFVYAEDRRALLEQALAVLQPDLATLQLLGGEAFEELVEEIAELREELSKLEDAQEEIEPHTLEAAKGEAPDTGDKDDTDDKDDKPEDPYLKAKPTAGAPSSSLTGPERKDEPRPQTTLTGPERKTDKPASTLTGPERKDEPRPQTTLTGPDRKDEPKPPTTLGDPKEIAAAVPPWWKRG